MVTRNNLSSEVLKIQDELLEEYARLAHEDYCRLCETCVPHCHKVIPIPDILRHRMYYNNYQWEDFAVNWYNKLPYHQKAKQCDECGKCEEHCPYELKIIEKILDAHSILTDEKTSLVV